MEWVNAVLCSTWSCAVAGMEVYVIGHGLFGLEHNLQPSVTSGIISKIISMNKVPVMIQVQLQSCVYSSLSVLVLMISLTTKLWRWIFRWFDDETVMMDISLFWWQNWDDGYFFVLMTKLCWITNEGGKSSDSEFVEWTNLSRSVMFPPSVWSSNLVIFHHREGKKIVDHPLDFFPQLIVHLVCSWWHS